MSASPAQAPSGKSSATPTGGPPTTIKRKKAPASIFHSKKKPVSKVANPPARKSAPSNGAQSRPAQQVPQQSRSVAGSSTNQFPPNTDEFGKYDEYPIFITKQMIDQGMRYHAAKLHSKNTDDQSTAAVDPYDESQFVRPLRLHRRYARDKMETADADDAASGMDDKEREQMTARRAERQAEREENQKLIAPNGGEAVRSKKKKPQKKTEEGRDNSDPLRQKRMQLRYEEARPWHLEDFESKNVWIGSYEQALSEHSILLTVEDGGFKMVPVEKWYRFIQTNKVNTMDSEEVEKHMNKKFTLPRWALGTQLDNEIHRKELQQAKAQAIKMRPRDEDEVKLEDDHGEFAADRDMLDLDLQDEFQDDDEGMLFQGDDDEAGDDIAKRIYLEMREAGLGGTGVKNDDVDVEEEERKKQIAEREEKKKGKRLRKQLRKKEMRPQYGSDSDSDPYASSSEDIDSDEEAERIAEEKKKEEEARKTGQVNSDKSGASTLGNNTPSSRSEKRDRGSKRPGDDSDLSGNESSRKRAKVANGSSLNRPASGRKLYSSANVRRLLTSSQPMPLKRSFHAPSQVAQALVVTLTPLVWVVQSSSSRPALLVRRPRALRWVLALHHLRHAARFPHRSWTSLHFKRSRMPFHLMVLKSRSWSPTSRADSPVVVESSLRWSRLQELKTRSRRRSSPRQCRAPAFAGVWLYRQYCSKLAAALTRDNACQDMPSQCCAKPVALQKSFHAADDATGNACGVGRKDCASQSIRHLIQIDHRLLALTMRPLIQPLSKLLLFCPCLHINFITFEVTKRNAIIIFKASLFRILADKNQGYLKHSLRRTGNESAAEPTTR